MAIFFNAITFHPFEVLTFYFYLLGLHLCHDSGQMWSHIRGPLFLQKTQAGNIAYICGSSQGQFIVETYIIAMLSK